MSSLTSRMALYKPASGENVNVTTDLDNNLDSIDLNMNFRTCTSSTRPSTRWDGLTIHETDTRKSYVWNATPAVSGWYQIYTAEASLPAVNLSGATTATQNITSNVTADTNQRFQVRADGRLEWGSGSAATDAFLRRTGVNALTTDGGLTVAGTTTVQSTTESTALSVSGGATVTKSLTVGGTASLGNGQGVLNLVNAAAAPTGTLTNGIAFYSESTRPKWANTPNQWWVPGTQQGGTVSNVSNTTTETTFLSITIPANEAASEGIYRITCFGNVTTSATATSLALKGYVGTVDGTSQSYTATVSPTTSVANGSWKLETVVRFRSPGATANAWMMGTLYQKWDVTSSSTPVNPFFGSSNTGATPDTTAPVIINLTAKWAAANASNTFITRGWFMERLV